MLSRQIIGNIDELYTHKNNELLISAIVRHSTASRNIMGMLDISEGRAGIAGGPATEPV